MKLSILVTEDKRKRRVKTKAPKRAKGLKKTKTPRTPKAKTPAKAKKNFNWAAYWAKKRKANKTPQAQPQVNENKEN